MTAPKRITKRDNFLALSRVVVNSNISDDEKVRLSEFISHEIALLDKRHAKSGPTKAQRLNEGVKTDILNTLSDSEGLRATEIANALGLSVQKVTALLRQMVEENLVVREQDKKVVTFRVAE